MPRTSLTLASPWLTVVVAVIVDLRLVVIRRRIGLDGRLEVGGGDVVRHEQIRPVEDHPHPELLGGGLHEVHSRPASSTASRNGVVVRVDLGIEHVAQLQHLVRHATHGVVGVDDRVDDRHVVFDVGQDRSDVVRRLDRWLIATAQPVVHQRVLLVERRLQIVQPSDLEVDPCLLGRRAGIDQSGDHVVVQPVSVGGDRRVLAVADLDGPVLVQSHEWLAGLRVADVHHAHAPGSEDTALADLFDHAGDDLAHARRQVIEVDGVAVGVDEVDVARVHGVS